MKSSAILAAVACLSLGIGARANARERMFNEFGTTADFARAAALKQAGLTFMTGSTSKLLMPGEPEEAFAGQLEKVQACPLPLMACNGFIRPKHLRCVGKEANHDLVLEWAEVAFRRLSQAGGKFMVFGSSGSRALRDGWPVERANEQFVALLKRMGPLAEEEGVTVVVESLNARECNYLTRLAATAEVVRRVDHPHVRVCADLYHMAMEGEGPEVLEAAMDVVAHIEIAEKKGRTYPGVNGQNFRPYFRVLRDAGYHGAINIEGRGEIDQIGPAIAEIAKQETDVLAE